VSFRLSELVSGEYTTITACAEAALVDALGKAARAFLRSARDRLCPCTVTAKMAVSHQSESLLALPPCLLASANQTKIGWWGFVREKER